MTTAEKDAIINPSSGLFARNPTHIEEANDANDQEDIVKAIKGAGAKQIRVRYAYADVDPKNPIPLMGILKIRDMPEESIVKLCQNLMRNRPNIFRVNIKLGNYPSARRIDNNKTRVLASSKQRHPTEIGEKIGDLFADKALNVVEISYRVNDMNQGAFSTTAEVHATTSDEYSSDEFFSPVIEFEYIKVI